MTTTSTPRTVLPERKSRTGAPQSRPRQLGIVRIQDVLAVLGALAGALCTTALLWTEVAPFSGLLGYIVVTWCLFIFYYAALVSMDQNRPTMRDRVAAVAVHSLAAVVLIALGFAIGYTFSGGYHAFVHLNFYTQDMHLTGQQDPLTSGGVLYAIVGTLFEVGIAIGIAAPLGLLAAVYLHEVPGRLSRFVRTIVQAMTALPDVIAGLFIYAILVVSFGRGFSGVAAGCALGLTALPIICRAADVVLRLVPGGLIEAAYALGAGQWRTVRLVTLPTARSGLATAVILGTARAIGETAPVLLTAGATSYFNFNPLHGPMMSLPLLAYNSVAYSGGYKNEIARGFGAASVLLVLVVLLFAIARAIGGRGPGQLSAGQARRRAARSRRDMARYAQRTRAAQFAGAAMASGYQEDGQ